MVGDDDACAGPFYVQNPFDAEPGWGVSAISFEVKELIDRAARTS